MKKQIFSVLESKCRAGSLRFPNSSVTLADAHAHSFFIAYQANSKQTSALKKQMFALHLTHLEDGILPPTVLLQPPVLLVPDHNVAQVVNHVWRPECCLTQACLTQAKAKQDEKLHPIMPQPRKV